MNATELALLLAARDGADQAELIRAHRALAGSSLAEELRTVCYDAWLADPEKARRVISALEMVDAEAPDEETGALALWGKGIGKILDGRMEDAIALFDSSVSISLEGGRSLEAAETQVGKLYALAVLGRYEEAEDCGLSARQVFLDNGKTLSAGKIEHNLGNICQRRDDYAQAEAFLLTARARFERHGEFRRLIQSDNSLANALAHRHRFEEADRIYNRALTKATDLGLEVTIAEIESNLGQLNLFRGRVESALKLFDSSRRRYDQMGLNHQVAISEFEIATSYLELNLASEAASLFRDAARVFRDLAMKAETARAMSGLARCSLIAGRHRDARTYLAESESLFQKEGNAVGLAGVRLLESRILLENGEHPEAVRLSAEAESSLKAAELLGLALQAKCVRGEALRQAGDTEEARIELRSALDEARAGSLGPAEISSLSSLGLIERSLGNTTEALSLFRKAVDAVERMRAPLPADEFRRGFLSDKLTPYNELVSLLVAEGGSGSLKEAFRFAEMARSRALLDRMGAGFDAEEESGELLALREELNWLYSRLNRSAFDAKHDPRSNVRIQEEIRTRENRLLEAQRKRSIGSAETPQSAGFSFEQIAGSLGDDGLLVQYLTVDGELSAFVISRQSLFFVKLGSSLSEVARILESLRAQIVVMKSQRARNSPHVGEMVRRCGKYQHELYLRLLAPLEPQLKRSSSITIVPHGVLHHVPFHALSDGSANLIETHEVSTAPSASVYLRCADRRASGFRKAVFVGVEDDRTPHVRAEVESLADLFEEPVTLFNEDATFENLKIAARRAGLVHIACHGNYRPDNPLFSSLKLSGDWLTARDSAALRLDSPVVVLSACETGMSQVYAGDELLGFAGGFLSAGAASLVLSLWQIDDEQSAILMGRFYSRLLEGKTVASALRKAQIETMADNPHPFFWAPFTLIGA